jgi:chemotaxis protein methyltransferase CheR
MLVSEKKYGMNVLQLSSHEFETVAELVYENCGINLEPCKKTMVESRLNRRLRALNISTFGNYLQFVNTKDGIENELSHLIDVLTTNKTDFFREIHHFDFMMDSLLPEFMKSNGTKTMKVWSAACSSGEEPYTIAMVLQEFARLNASFAYEVLASDISTQVLQKAIRAIYHADRANDIPAAYRSKYLLRGKDHSNPRIRVTPELRTKVRFERINLIDDALNVEQVQDVIFCRNVLIYFDRETQLKVIRNLLANLRSGGLLFIGHSESLHFFDLPIRQIRPTIFFKH